MAPIRLHDTRPGELRADRIRDEPRARGRKVCDGALGPKLVGLGR
jgi:hypothetical protein